MELYLRDERLILSTRYWGGCELLLKLFRMKLEWYWCCCFHYFWLEDLILLRSENLRS